MKKIKKLSFLVFLASCLILASCAQAADKNTKMTLAPDFKLQDLDQNTYTLSSYKDKQAVALFFWTTWCPYCRKAMKILNTKYPELEKNGVELLAINVQESASRVESFAKREGLGFKVLLDQDAEASELFEVMGVPTYVLINKQGNIVFRDNYFPYDEYKALLSDNGG